MGTERLWSYASRRPVGEMKAALEAALARRPVILYALVDHARDMRARGVEGVPETYTFIFGNPRLGAGLVAVSPAAVADMPLRLGLIPDGPGSRVVYRRLAEALADHDPALAAPGQAADELVAAIVQEADASGPAPGGEEA
ncbi:MAG: DUF302 domain-containing protein [Firmicutes bacterium]|nr:DUF302 domain-containing protein [Bacillota bacterium]